MDRQELGKHGENLACAELARLGYEILARRYRTRFGEIDVIARDRGTFVFVEVKTRRGGAYGAGALAVTAWKRRRIARMALHYLLRRGALGAPARFDVVEVELGARGPRIAVYPHAFDVRTP